MLRLLLLAAILARWAPIASAQTAESAAKRTTLEGVYTRDQATAGREVYAGMCQSCHALASHTGTTFATWWAGKQLSDLFSFVSEKMPKNAPGSLSPEEYTNVVALLLRMNGMPAGDDELPADTLVLKRIRIELKKAP